MICDSCLSVLFVEFIRIIELICEMRGGKEVSPKVLLFVLRDLRLFLSITSEDLRAL